MATNTRASISPHQASQNPRQLPTRKVLSCTSCRQRKTKCDKADPCNPCLESGLECIYPTRRTRASRGHPDALKARDEELLRRVRHLESMLANNADTGVCTPTEGPFNAPATSVSNLPPLRSDGPSSGIGRGVTVDDQYAAFVKQQGSSSRHLNSGFWSTLSNEFDSLRELIEGHVDNEDDVDEWDSPSMEGTYSSPNMVFYDSGMPSNEEPEHPWDAHSAVLFRVYFNNVDPVCKILHRPTVNTYFSNMAALFEPSTRRFKFRSLEAVTFAVYFAAVNSMSSEECLTYLGEDKENLSARYKRSTEILLEQADFMNALEITTLQALTIYIIARRSLSQGRSNYTLIGLAVRIAYSLGLHQDGNGQAFIAFEAEMRRRLFWQILALDMRASEDRGSEPTLTEHSFNTTMPLNLDDKDFGHDSQHPLYTRTGPTEMTLCLLEIHALCTSWKINLGLSALESKKLALREREDLVRDYARRVEFTYLANHHSLDQKTRLLYEIGHYWIHKLWLMLYYPLRHQGRLEQVHSSNQGLQTAVRFLKSNELVEQHPSSAGFTWLFRTYAPWQAVAVALAEICNQPHSALADAAWEIIGNRFSDWSGRLVSTKEAMLWGPIKNMLKRARTARQHSQESVEAQQGANTSEMGLPLLDPNASVASSFGFDLSNSTDGFDRFKTQSLNDFSLFGQVTEQRLDDFSFASIDSMAPKFAASSASGNLDSWNNFTYDVNALSGEYFSESYGM